MPDVAANECPGNPDALGVSRVLEVDTSGGPRLGRLQYGQTLDLEPKEVVLTFDDGPHPRYTRRILKALDRECVKATFFPVGVWARQIPHVLRLVAERGHTVGTHTWSHPLHLGRLSFASAQQQIEKGIAAIETALGRPPAPFFRFPGLNHTRKLKDYLGTRDTAVFSCDIATDDWRGIGPRTILRRTLARLRRKGRGIVLFHDTKSSTAKALPKLLRALKQGGYRIVHIVPREAPAPVPSAVIVAQTDSDDREQTQAR
ncbi:MAG: polysaccharide deacetylase family protein [Hyphomicrobiales bacterium]|nr:polysaccharide deacetylase family protein [Hyphomicrobiales bacterium]